MVPTALIPWLDPHTLIVDFGPWAVLAVCVIIFAETGLLIGFLFPGDTLLLITGLLTFQGVIHVNIWWVALAIGLAAFIGGEVGYYIGKKAGPSIFERKENGLFSISNVKRTNAFFDKYGGFAVILARFVPVVRTFAPIAAGVGKMNYKKYSVYNAIGAFIWGAGITFIGYLLGNIRPVADFVTKYIDIVLVAVVLITLVPVAFHYVQGLLRARKANKEGTTTAPESLVLDESLFDQDKSNDRK